MMQPSEHDGLLGSGSGRFREEHRAGNEQCTGPTRYTPCQRILGCLSEIISPSSAHRLLSCLGFVFTTLLPSYIGTLILREKSSSKPCHNISSLDGLRGLACVAVFNYHWAWAMGNDWSAEREPNQCSIFYRPFIYNLWNGSGMVYVFFVISGYVLSYKSVRLVRSVSSTDLHACLASAVLRRALRLYIPVMALIFMTAVAAQLHVFDRGTQVFEHNHTHNDLPRIGVGKIVRLGSFQEQMLDALGDCANIFSTLVPWDPHSDHYRSKYEPVTWTIPVEFRGSMAVFVFLLGTSRLRVTYRLSIQVLAVTYCFISHHIDVFLFLSGMALVEIDSIRRNRITSISLQSLLPATTYAPTASHDDVHDTAHIDQRRTHALYLCVLLGGLFGLSVPKEHPESIPGFTTLISTMNHLFDADSGEKLRALGAVMTVWTVANYNFIDPVFTNPVSHYIGQISFALYLLHCGVIRSLGFAIIPWSYQQGAGVENIQHKHISQMGQAKAWLLGYIVILPVTLWISDLFWRGVDVNAVKFARWLENGMSVREP